MIKISDIQNHVWQTVHAKVYFSHPFYSARKMKVAFEDVLKVGRIYDTISAIVRTEFTIRFHEDLI